MSCEHCTDPDGCSCMPMYGLAPHRHGQLTDKIGVSFGGTALLPKEEWPDNFIEDAEIPGMGTWFCPWCREGL